MNTFDKYSNCPSFIQYCSDKSVKLGDGTYVSDSCPRTCGKFNGNMLNTSNK